MDRRPIPKFREVLSRIGTFLTSSYLGCWLLIYDISKVIFWKLPSNLDGCLQNDLHTLPEKIVQGNYNNLAKRSAVVPTGPVIAIIVIRKSGERIICDSLSFL